MNIRESTCSQRGENSNLLYEFHQDFTNFNHYNIYETGKYSFIEIQQPCDEPLRITSLAWSADGASQLPTPITCLFTFLQCVLVAVDSAFISQQCFHFMTFASDFKSCQICIILFLFCLVIPVVSTVL